MKIRAIEKYGIKTDAVVTHIRLLKFSKGASDSVTLEYTDHAGTRHPAKVSTVPGHYKIGNTMPLKYPDNKPSRYIINGMQQAQWVLLTFSILLLVFSIFASYKIHEMAQAGNY